MADNQDPDDTQDLADAVHGLTEQTKALVHKEVSAVQHEMLGRLKSNMPAIALTAGAMLSGTFAGAALYRLSTRMLEKWLSPTTASLIAVLGYGLAAGRLGMVGLRAFKAAPLPAPMNVAKDLGSTVASEFRTSE
jgi:hypothetical protein